MLRKATHYSSGVIKAKTKKELKIRWMKAESYKKIILGLFLLIGLNNLVMAQTHADGATSKLTQPGTPAGSYALSGFENVNLFNGNLNFSLPLAQIGGRGQAQSPINLSIDSARWNVEHSWSTQETTSIAGGAIYSFSDLNVILVPCTTTSPPDTEPGQNRPCSPDSFEEYTNNFVIDGRIFSDSPGFSYEDFVVSEDICSIKPGYGPGLIVGRGGRLGGGMGPRVQPQTFFTLTRLYFITPDGTEHELRDELTGGEPKRHYANQNVSRGTNFASSDGSGIKFVSASSIDEVWINSENDCSATFYPTGTLYLPNGTKYQVVEGTIRTIEDVDGNKIVYTYNGNRQVETVVDSLGRQVRMSYDNPAGDPNDADLTYDKIETQKSATEWQTVKIYRTKLGNALRGDFTLKSKAGLFPELQLVDNELYNPGNVVKKIELPNDKTYQLSYTSYNEIARVVLPTGAAIEYEFPTASYAAGTIFRPVLERKTYADGGSGTTNSQYDSWQKYIRYPLLGTYPDYESKITVEEHSGNVNADEAAQTFYTDHYFNGAPNSLQRRFYSKWNEGREFKTETFDKDGQLRSRSETEWVNPQTVVWGDGQVAKKVQVNSVTTTAFENGKSLTSKTAYAYDNDSLTNNKKDEWIFDFGTNGAPGRILKHSHIDYLAVNTNNNNLDYTSDVVYLHGLPAVTTLYEVNPNLETLISQISIKYDETDYLDLNGTAVVGWTNPNRTTRGKPTSSSVWLYETSPTSGRWLTTHTKYDAYGNPIKTWGASSNPNVLSNQSVEIEYSATYLYALPTKVRTVAPDPSGTFGTDQISEVSSVYDFYTGQALSVTDANGQTATTEYNDVLLRPTKTTAPNGQQLTYEYGDAIGNLYVRVRKQIDGANWNEATTFYDGLGRAVKTTTKDDQGDVSAETIFDNLGRVKKVSNPHRANEPVYWSRTDYDELGRVKQTYAPALAGQTGASLGVMAFDISTVPNYVGSAVISTDAAGRKSRAVTNALGQLVRVDEPTATGGTIDADLGTLAAPVQPTYYSYDALGRMVKVAQGGQTRFFLYDSMGRMLRVRQPEQEVNAALALTDAATGNNQWTAGFTYDDNGNVLTTTDAQGVTVTNTYDRLNRVLTRTYTGEAAGRQTPTVYLTYDGVYYRADSYKMQAAGGAKGALTQVRNGISTTQTTAFDQYGRLLVYQQITDGQTYQTGYQYNFAGALVEETYPSGRVVKNTFRADGDLAGISSRVVNGQYKNYASNFSYTAAGIIDKLQLGNGRWETAKLNERQQITELALGVNQTDTSLWKVNYDYGELNTDGTTVDAVKNTGNIAKQTISFAGLANPFVQTYKYDSVNRLTEAKELSGTNQTWKQTYSYDRFGNRSGFYQKIGNQELAIDNHSNPQIDQTTNRFLTSQGYGYDKNGNIITDADGRQFTFNGENKQTEVKDANNNVIGQYFYDGEGKRVKKVTATETVTFVYSGGKLVAEYSSQPPPSNPTTNYTATDPLGSPRVITNAQGAVVSRRDFMPFGEELLPEGIYRKTDNNYTYGDTIRQRFTGYQKDEETHLDFAEARYYNNKHARFTAVDPLLASGKSANPQTFNRYVYVGNNPLIRVDPNGLEWVTKLIGEFNEQKWVTRKAYDRAIKQGWTDIKLTNGVYRFEGIRNGTEAGIFELRADGSAGWVEIYSETAKRKEQAEKEANSGGLNDTAKAFGLGFSKNYERNIVALTAMEAGVGAIIAAPVIADVALGSAASELTTLGLSEGTATSTTTTATETISSNALVRTTQISDHATLRFAERGISESMVKSGVRNGLRFFDPKNNSVNYVVRNGFASGKDFLVGTNPFTGNVTTVIRGTNLIRPRFIPIP